MGLACSLFGHAWDDETRLEQSGAEFAITKEIYCVRCKKSHFETIRISRKSLLEDLIENERQFAVRRKYGF